MAPGCDQPIYKVASHAYKAVLHKTSEGRLLGGYQRAIGYSKVLHI